MQEKNQNNEPNQPTLKEQIMKFLDTKDKPLWQKWWFWVLAIIFLTSDLWR